MKQHTFTTTLVEKVATLAALPLQESQVQKLQSAFEDTLAVIENLKELDISKVEPTHQVTGLTNILREDSAPQGYSFSQEQALANAQHTHQGYFVVERVLDNE